MRTNNALKSKRASCDQENLFKNILPCIRQAKCTYFLTDCAMERTAAEMKNKLESGGQKKKTTKRTKHNHN
jgi:hypothetical protein